MKYSKLEISIPQIVTARDYHEFSEYEDFLNELGLNNIRITEVGLADLKYIGVLHQEGDMHQEFFQMMKKEFRELSDSDEPFNADEILNKYYGKDGK